MNCCGKKRSAWLNEVREKASAPMDKSPPSTARTTSPGYLVFEFTGESPATFRGAVTGKVYRFDFKGQKVNVDYADSFALMAERDLRYISQR
jgi:hypothetical protein